MVITLEQQIAMKVVELQHREQPAASQPGHDFLRYITNPDDCENVPPPSSSTAPPQAAASLVPRQEKRKMNGASIANSTAYKRRRALTSIQAAADQEAGPSNCVVQPHYDPNVFRKNGALATDQRKAGPTLAELMDRVPSPVFPYPPTQEDEDLPELDFDFLSQLTRDDCSLDDLGDICGAVEDDFYNGYILD